MGFLVVGVGVERRLVCLVGSAGMKGREGREEVMNGVCLCVRVVILSK